MAFVLNEGPVYFRVFFPPCENAALSDVKKVVCSIMQEKLIMVFWTQKNHISSTRTIVCERMCDNSSLLWPQWHSQIKSSSLKILICLFLGEKYFLNLKMFSPADTKWQMNAHPDRMQHSYRTSQKKTRQAGQSGAYVLHLAKDTMTGPVPNEPWFVGNICCVATLTHCVFLIKVV